MSKYDFSNDRKKELLADRIDKEFLITLKEYRRLETVFLKVSKLGWFFLVEQLEKQGRIVSFSIKDCRSATPVQCWQLRDCLCHDYGSGHISSTHA